MDLSSELHAFSTHSPAHFIALGQDQGLSKGFAPHPEGEISA